MSFFSFTFIFTISIILNTFSRFSKIIIWKTQGVPKTFVTNNKMTFKTEVSNILEKSHRQYAAIFPLGCTESIVGTVSMNITNNLRFKAEMRNNNTSLVYTLYAFTIETRRVEIADSPC